MVMLDSIGLNKFGIFLFTLIYVVVITAVVAVFSGQDPATISTAFASTPMQDTKVPGNGLDWLTAGAGMIGNFLSMMWSVIALRIPYVPAVVGFLMALPVYLFLVVLVDYMLDIVKTFKPKWF